MNDETAAQRLGQVLRKDGATPLARAAQDQELARLLRTVRAVGRPEYRATRWKLAAAFAAAAVAILGALSVFRARPDLTYDVRGVARIDERSVSAESGEPVELRFSDGSRVELSPGARVRVDARTPQGAKLSLLQGDVLATVRHRANTQWSVSAGPFVVRVVGTRFRTSWSAERRALMVDLYEGAVQVQGGPMHQPVSLHAGQHLEADTSSEAVRITPLVPQTITAEAPLSPAAEPSPEQPLRSNASTRRTTSWSTLMTRSDFASIIEEARAMGFAACLNSCSPTNLRILADAARYTGDAELAENSLLALKRRAPAQAATADFFLGRLYEVKGRSSEALDMYERHLTAAPRGDYAEQAQAGAMRMLVRLGQGARARAAAKRYLAAFPTGVHAAFAARLLEGEASP